MNEQSLFTAALGLSAPWEVASVQFDQEQGRIDFKLKFQRGSKFSCAACSLEGQPLHDTRPRTWRHLNFFQYEAYIHADVPRTKCTACGKVSQVPVAWASSGSGFTLLFEALILTLCRVMPVNTVAQLLCVGADALWVILKRHVTQARRQEDFSKIRRVGIDETASRRGHNYITLVHDMDARRLIFGCSGRDQATIASFVKDLKAHQGDPLAINAACIDMSKAYIAGVSKQLPNADITFDPFHIIQLANQALEAVRRDEVKYEPILKKSRWIWLKDQSKWSVKQSRLFKSLPKTRLLTARAWRLKQSLRELFQTAQSSSEAALLFDAWYSWARRCRLEPFKRLATTLLAHRQGILNGFDSGLSNGYVEGANSLIQAAKAKARGYRRSENMITIAYLLLGKLEHLPRSPFNTRCSV
jgi:transposase